MRRTVGFALGILLCLSSLGAKIEVDLFGYFETQAMGLSIKREVLPLFSNKLRVDLKSRLSDTVTFAANFNGITYHGKTTWNILDFLPQNFIGDIPDNLKPFYVMPFADRYYLDNAYIKFALKGLDIMVGKQQISLGTGYVWNPTDIFNVKDYLDPTYEQPGHNALRIDLPLGSGTTVTGLYAPDETWRDSAKLLRFKTRLLHFDVALLAVEKVWRFHDYTRLEPAQGGFYPEPHRRRLLGACLAGELLGLGVWAEAGYNEMESRDDFFELVVGSDYTFDFQTYIMVEYFHSTLGRRGAAQYTLNDWMRLLAQEQKTLTRDQLYTLVRHPVSDFINLGVSGIYSITDRSLALVPTMDWSISDNVDLLAYLNLAFGREGTAYAKNMGSGGMIRVRVYF